MKESEKFHRMAEWAERKADEAAASDAPWAMGNLRTYQNYMSKFLGMAYAAEKQEAAQ